MTSLLHRVCFGACLASAALVVPACAADAGTSRPIVEAEAWTRLPPEHDPFTEALDEAPFCLESAWKVEPTTTGRAALEVNLAQCNGFTATQPLLAPLAPGDRVRVRLRHGDLTSRVDAESVLRIDVDGSPLWERRVPLPHDRRVPAALLDDTVEVSTPAHAGADVRFHARNHGPNTYILLSIDSLPRRD